MLHGDYFSLRYLIIKVSFKTKFQIEIVQNITSFLHNENDLLKFLKKYTNLIKRKQITLPSCRTSF